MNLATIKTKENLNVLKFDIDELLLKHNSVSDIENFVKDNLSYITYDFYRSELSDLSKDALEKKLKELVNFLNSVAVLNLTIAFVPTNVFLNKLYKWATANISPNVIIDFTVKPEIVAGCLIEYQGKLYDKSLVSKIQKYDIERLKA